MSHPGVGLDKWTDLTTATAFVGKEGLLAHDDRVNESFAAPFDAAPNLQASRNGRPD